MAARLEEVHHDEPEGDADRHVEEKNEERAAGERPELVEAAELDDAGGERGEDEGNDDEEEQPQKNLAERIEVVRRGAPHEGERGRGKAADDERGDTGGDTDAESDEDAIGEGTVGFGHGGIGMRRLLSERNRAAD